MNVFKISRGIRTLGIGYGLPCWYIDFGPGLSYEPLKLVEKMISMGLRGGVLVVLKNPLRERGTHLLVQGLKSLKCTVEVEESGTSKEPIWFPEVDRWLVDWKEDNIFNYLALRPRQDMLLCRSTDLKEFLNFDPTSHALRAVVTKDVPGTLELLKDFPVRIYKEEG